MAWFITDGGANRFGASGTVWWVVWGVLVLDGVVLWQIFRRKAVEPVTEWSLHRRRVEGFTPETFQAYLVIAWSGAELAGIAGGLTFLFTGDLAQMVISLACSLICFRLSAPREEWFDDQTP